MKRAAAGTLVVLILFAITVDRSVAQPPTKPVVAPKPASATPPPVLTPELFAPLKWRSIGPTSMGGRIVDLAVVESDPSTFWVASASGGLFKTTNNGVTFEPQFQHAGSISIGDVCVAPSNPNIVWVGTGEHNPRNSVTWGDGVYKSIDGGKTWRNMGLRKSFQIGRIAVHPTNPDVVYVGALGRLWGQNPERGLFQTTDGGRTWQKILYLDDKTGCVDIAMHPRNPETLIVAMYERQRDPFDVGDPVKRWGPGSGLFRTTDGGKSWTKLSGGLPTVKMGRIGVTYSRSNPSHVFAMIETERIGEAPKGVAQPAFMGIQGDTARDVPRLTVVTPRGPANRAGLKPGDVITDIGGTPVKTYQDVTRRIRGYKAGDTVAVTVRRGEATIQSKVTFAGRGQTGRGAFSTRLGGQLHNVHQKQGKDGFQTGGVFKSTDGGDTWTRLNSLNPRPFYYSQIHVDPTNEQFVYVLGIQLYRSTDGGLSFRSDAGRTLHPDHHAMWIDPRDGRHIIVGCDGGLNITWDRTQRWEFQNNIPISQFYDVAVDARAPYRVFGGLQDNGSWGGPSRSRSSVGPTAHEWFAIGGGDGFVCRVDPENQDVVYYESQYGRMGRVNLKTGDRSQIRPRAENGERYRFSWKTPFQLSHHNSRIFYCAGNYVFKSLNRGTNLRRISPPITRTGKGTATAFAESPRDPHALYVGTDDGWLWGTRDGGRNWKRLDIPGRVGNRRVNAIEASRFADGRCYVVLDGHYFDSDAPDVWVTENFGATWQSLHAGLPHECTRVLREDVRNPDLLYLGTEFGIYASTDRGGNWARINRNLPNVAVHEIAVHPTAGEIVAATHGRGLWILDVAPLRQLTRPAVRDDVAFLVPHTAVAWHNVTGKRYYGSKRFLGENPENPATLYYVLRSRPGSVSLRIADVAGNTVVQLKPTASVGLNAVGWNLRQTSSSTGRGRRGGQDASSRPRTGPPRRIRPESRRPRRRPTAGKSLPTPASRPSEIPRQLQQRFAARIGIRVRPGTYLAVLTVDGRDFKQTLRVAADPDYPTNSLTFEEEEALRQMGKELDD